MPYRITTVETKVADDSNLSQVVYSRKASFYQTKDLKEAHAFVRVAPADSQVQVNTSSVTTGYFVEIRSDYPIMVRLNGSSNTQFTMNTNNVAATNVGAPLPDQCILVFTGQVTSVWVQPIASATQTANVKVVIVGDPLNAYT